MYMYIHRQILLIVCLLAQTLGMAQNTETALLQVMSIADTAVTVSFTVGTLRLSSTADGYARVDAEGMSSDAAEAGMPSLPRISTLMMLPRGSRLAMSRVTSESATERVALPTDDDGNTLLLMPWGGAAVKDAPVPTAEPDKTVYGDNSWYRGGDLMQLEHIGTLGEVEVFRLTVRPAEYNPVEGALRVVSHAVTTLSLTKGSAKAMMSGLPDRMMIVTRPQFGETLQPFVAWKRQEGYDVDVIFADTNKRDVVKALVDARWDDAQGRQPHHLLLVGDVAQIQSFLGTTRPAGLNGHATDLYYAEHTGDYLPDAFVGRWPVNDTSELRAVVEKTLRYEQCKDLDTAQLGRAILVAGKETGSPAPVTTNGQVNYVKGLVANLQTAVDTSCYYNPSSDSLRDDILNDIARGAGFLNYTAHCSTGGWTRPAVGFVAIDTLGCSQPMLYVNNCCQSNAFDGTCFGERLLRTPTGGAIGVIGATNSTLWDEDYYWAVGPKYPFSLTPDYDSLHPGAFDMWLGGDVATQGALLVSGNMAVTAFGSPYDKFYWEIYCLLGDPSLRPYLGTPHHINLSAPDSVDVGECSVRVSGTNGATVTAVQGDRLLGTVVLDDHRSSELRFRQPADTLPIVFTATMAQGVPVTDTAYTRTPQGRAVTFRDVSVVDTAVLFSLANIGTDTVFNLTTVVLCDDTAQAVFTTQAARVDTLAPGAVMPVHLGIHLLTWNTSWSGTLEAYGPADDNVTCRPLHVGGLLGDMPPSLHFTLLDTDSNLWPHISPDADYMLLTIADRQCDSLGVSLTSMPTGTGLPIASLPCSTFTTPDTVSHLHIEAIVTRGNYIRGYSYWIVAGSRTDSFEEGLESHPWDTTSLRPWQIDTTVSHSGRASVRSASIGNRQTSDLAIDILLDTHDSIAFWARTSSEQNYDKLIFSIDGVKQMDLSGNAGWRRCSYALSSGSHRLLWRYTKDDSGNNGSDCAWIDDVEMPLALWDAPYGWFGSIETVGIDTPSEAVAVLRAMPSPTSDMMYVTSTEATDGILTDITGRRLAVFHLDADTQHPVDLQGLAAGLYIIHTDNGASLKIIKH